MAFAPKGDRSLRVIVTDLTVKAQPGDVLTFTALAEELGIGEEGEAGRGRVRQAVASARKSLLRDHHRALVAVRGEGYRVALPGEFAGIAQDQTDKGQRQISGALATITYAPEADMSPAELTRHRAVGVAVRNLNNRLTSAEQRLADLEEMVFGPPRGQVIPGQVEPEGA
jgi:hypothetical protein